MTLRVLIVDDQQLFAAGLAMLIDAQPDMHVVALAIDGIDGIERSTALQPDVVLLDLRMPRLDGLAALPRIVDAAPRAAVIVLTTIRSEPAVAASLRAGADGFLTKDATPERVLDMIRRAASGEQTLGAAEVSRVIEPERATPKPAPAVLTPREQVVYLLCAKGLTNAEIAAAEHVSENTVKTQVRAILQKLELRSRVQIAIHAFEQGARP